MINNSLAGRCGLYCGTCGIYQAERDDIEYRKKLVSRFNCPPEKVRCNGCSTLTPDCWGFECKFVKCLNNKGFQFYRECPDYDDRSCEIFEKFSKDYLREDGVDLR